MNTFGPTRFNRVRPRGLAAAVMSITASLVMTIIPVEASSDTEMRRVGQTGPAGCTSTSVMPAANGWTVSPLDDAGRLAVTGSLTATMVFTDAGLWQVTTADGGQCWTPRTEILDPGHVANGNTGLAQQGLDLHTVVPAGGELRYHRSQDGGVSWDLPVGLDMNGAFQAFGTDIDVSKNGTRVAFAFDDGDDGVNVGVSTDGGDTWGPTSLVALTPACCSTQTQVALSGGTVLVPYWRSGRTLVVRRSTDDGQTWLPAQAISRRRHGDNNIQIASHGADVLVVFFTWGGIHSRISHDRGATWTKGSVLASDPGDTDMTLDYVAGRWRLLYGAGLSLHYRQSLNGLDWSTDVVVDPNLEVNDIFDIGMLNGHIVASMWAYGAAPYWLKRN